MQICGWVIKSILMNSSPLFFQRWFDSLHRCFINSLASYCRTSTSAIIHDCRHSELPVFALTASRALTSDHATVLSSVWPQWSHSYQTSSDAGCESSQCCHGFEVTHGLRPAAFMSQHGRIDPRHDRYVLFFVLFGHECIPRLLSAAPAERVFLHDPGGLN